MLEITKAKERFSTRFRSKMGYRGVGIGKDNNTDILRVYVENDNSPIINELKNETTFEGFPFIIKIIGKIYLASK